MTIFVMAPTCDFRYGEAEEREMISQTVYQNGTRKAIVTRIAPRKWVVTRGYVDETQLSYYPRPRCSTRRLAISYVNDWLGLAH